MNVSADRSEAKVSDAQARIAELEAALDAESRGRAELIHLVSHELRTPITVISGFARLLQDPSPSGLLDSRAESFVEEILKACHRLDAFVSELIEVGPDAGQALAIECEHSDLRKVLDGVLESLGPMLSEHGLTVSSEIDEAVPKCVFDPRRIEQVVTNLMTNAIRYGRKGGVVRTAIKHALVGGAPFAVMSVEDDGPGIPEADRERLFSPYMRGSDVAGTDGLGIGLAICRRIIEAHSGTIHVEEGALGGARFVVALPLTACTEPRD